MSRVFLNNTILTFSRQAVGGVATLVISMIIGRVLGPEGQGQYSLIVFLPVILSSILEMGISVSTIYYVGKNDFSVNDAIKGNLILFILLSVLAIILGIIFIYFWGDSFFKNINIELFYIGLLVLPALFLIKYLQCIFRAKEHFFEFNIVFLIGQILLFSLSFLAVYVYSLGIYGAIGSLLIARYLSALLSLSLILKKYYQPQSVKLNIKLYLKKVVPFGLKSHIANVLLLLNNRFDLIIIAYFLTSIQVGYYSVSVALVESIWIFSQAIGLVYYARLSNMRDLKRRWGLTLRILMYVFMITAVSASILYIFAPEIIEFIYGSKFLPSVKPLRILIVGILIFTVGRILTHFINASGRPLFNSYISFTTVLVNIIMNIVLIPIYGLIGAAIATSTAYSLDSLIKVIVAFKIKNEKYALLDFTLP